MRLYLAMMLSLLPFFVAGCIAYGGDGGIPVNWGSLLTVYGPLGGIAIWLMKRDKVWFHWIAKRDEEWKKLLKENTEVLTQVKETLTLTRVDDEKHRTAIYRLVEEVRDVKANVAASGNTRIISRES